MEKVCSFCGSNKEVGMSGKYGDYLCHKHYMQYYHSGKLTMRCMKDPNEIVIYDDFAEIILYNKDKNEKARAIIDLEDVEKVKKYKWGLMNEGYVNSKLKNGDTLMLHNYINNLEANGEWITSDHIDRNPLNNRRNNLRNATYSENNINQELRSQNTSGKTGVSWDKKNQKWHTYIGLNGHRVHLGYFDELCYAIKTRKEAEIKYFGEFSPTFDNQIII